LAEIAKLNLQSAQLDVLAEMNAFNIEGRYPDSLSIPPEKKEAVRYIRQAEKVFKWLIQLS
jgi:HEPN domain-containing protein